MQNTAEVLRPPASERLAEGRVKGSIVRAHVDWVRDHRDRNEVIEFFEAIPSGMRALFSAEWYAFREVIEVDRVVMHWFGGGDPRFIEELGVYAARQNLSGVYRRLRRSGVHEFFRRVPQLHRQFHDFGTAAYDELGPGEGQVVLTDCPSYTPLYCAHLIGFYHECIRLHGGVNVAVWESSCQCRGEAACTFEMLWS